MSVRSNRSTRRWGAGLGAVLALLAITAIPSFAAKPPAAKTVGMSVTPATASPSTSAAFRVTLTNTTPGNSNPNSFRITAPVGYTITNAVYTSGTNPNSGRSVTFDAGARTVSVTGLDPLKSTGGQNVVITVTATTPAAPGCGTVSGLWAVTGFTGSGLTGDTFARNTPDADATTTVAAACTVTIAPDPIPGVARNASFQVSVSVSDATYAGTISLDATSEPSAGALDITAGTQSAGSRTFTLSGSATGDYTIRGSASGLTATDTATFTVYDDGITCEGTSGPIDGGGSTATLDRTDAGPNSGCVDVPYTMTVTRDEIVLLKDQAVVDQQGAQFRITITWGVPAGAYPSFGTTTFDIDGDGPIGAFTPDNCDVVSGDAQYPNNPDGNGSWPDSATADQPWCFEGATVQPDGGDLIVTESFLGSGDPTIKRS